MPVTEKRGAPLYGVHELSPQVFETYARLWQFETWLRRMVYVQLRAAEGDGWETKVKASEWSKTSDKRLTHMPTAEDDVLSFIQLSELKRVVKDHWHLFTAYLPPQSVWDARLEEITAIRNRVMHFRTIHNDDLARVTQFLRDIDKGFWSFCTVYNNVHPVLPQTNDPVVTYFLSLDLIPWGQTGDGTWARIGSADPREPLHVSIEIVSMPWAVRKTHVAGEPGFLYDVTMHARGQRRFKYEDLLRATRARHKHLVHICLDELSASLRLTIPACLGEDTVKGIIETFQEAALNNLRPRPQTAEGRVQAFADTMPEYILGPRNPLTFLGPDMPCSFFNV